MTSDDPAEEILEAAEELSEATSAVLQNLPEVLPVLPLRNTVLFPLVVTPMLVTTDRARRLVEDAVAGRRVLVAVAAKSPDIKEPGPDDLHQLGTIVRVLRVVTSEDGDQRIWVQGMRRVRIGAYESTEPYLSARAELLYDRLQPGIEIEALHRNVSNQFVQIAENSSTISEPVQTMVQGLEDSAALTDVVAANLSLSLEDRQALLETLDVRQRLERLSELLAREQEVKRLEGEIREQVQEELTKNQREYVLREQARAIRKQLGEFESSADIVEQLRKRLNDLVLPEEVREQTERELGRLAALPPGAMEAGTLRNYVEWILDLPWNVVSRDEIDVADARKILEEDHYGLEKVKERILEYLAVLKLKRDMRGPILCFVGPPGTGKTSLGRSIARAIGREFARISLGGVRDEAEIRGHRRTYVGSMPGRIIQTMKRVGAANPVMMLDEIDKLGADFRGDPASALLEVLDPEQNHSFSDHYLEVPFDLSNVLFIATANMLETIPPPLRDRMEVIEVPGYTEEDKLQIARQYLVPRQLKRNGVEDLAPELTDEGLRLIISGYTREAGVRNLERELGKTARKIARRVVDEKSLPKAIGPVEVRSMLGPVRFEPEVAGRVQLPGVSVGLSVSQAGGGILFIEATRMPGRGKVKITGSLGDVMRESAETAITLVRSFAEELGLDEKVFRESDLHIHVPSGGTPKDGPSAGIAIVTALASLLLDRPVPPDLAMTGEITLRGKVLPVGGIKEKVLAAKRAGLSRVLIPARNEKDLVEIPGERLGAMKIERVETVDEVLRHAFGIEVMP